MPQIPPVLEPPCARSPAWQPFLAFVLHGLVLFEDLPPASQRGRRVQLCPPGDVSAVLETPGGFQAYICKEKTDTALTVACLSLPKRRYEQRLEEQRGLRPAKGRDALPRRPPPPRGRTFRRNVPTSRVPGTFVLPAD
jgi:hypothetical protein